MRGPIDYIIVGFDGSEFDGSVLKALDDAVNNGIIAIVDLAIVSKDKNGVYTEAVYSNHNDETTAFVMKHQSSEKVSSLNNEDFNEVASLMENDTTAGVLVIEHLWAKPLKQALINKKGYLIAEGRIHPEAAAELNKGE